MHPVNYTLPYYQGDDLSIIIYPKNSEGYPIDIVPTDTAFFKIADKRGNTSTVRVVGTGTIQDAGNRDDNDNVVYAIVATLDGTSGLNVKNGYVYDVGYVKDTTTVTVLTGTMSVVERVVAP